MVDYGKWEQYDCDEDEDIKMNYELSMKEITNRKETADHIFAEAIAAESVTPSMASSSSDYKSLYQRSLELYLSVIQEILRDPQLTHLYVPCQLNCATCYLKLKIWNQCIRICDNLLETKPCILSTIQLIRCHYFRAFSYFEGSKNEMSLRSALTSSLAIQNLIETSTVEISEEDKSDSHLLHQKLTAHLQDQREGWKLISESKYLEALKWFHDAVHSNPNSAEFDDLDLLSSYFEGIGAAYDGMEDFSKASSAYERAAELKSNTVSTLFDELDLSSKNFFQRLLLFSAHSSLRDSLSTLLEGTVTNKMYQKEEYQTKIKRSGELFLRLITFTNRFSEPDLFTHTSSLYAGLILYGRACTHFLAPRYQNAIETYQNCVVHISKFLSTQSTPTTCPQSLTLHSHNFLFYYTLNLHKQSNLRYATAGFSETSTLLTQYLSSLNSIFSLCLPLRYCNHTVDSVSSHYSILFDSLIWSLYCSLILKKYPECMRLCDDFSCYIEKYSQFISNFTDNEKFSIESWLWVKKLTILCLVVKCFVYNSLDCIDLEIQKELYSQLFLQTQELSQHLSKTNTPEDKNSSGGGSVVGDFSTHVTWDCYEIFHLVTKYFFQNSKFKPFQLNDEILHNDNSEISPLMQQVVELSTGSIKATARYLRLLHCHMNQLGEKYEPFTIEFSRLQNKEEVFRYSSLVISKLHEATMCYLQLHFWRGLCASDRAQGQRYFECCHTACEDYNQTRSSSQYSKMALTLEQITDSTFPKPRPIDPLETHVIWRNEFLNICGDTSFHLAYTYMRSGKIQYALEEIRKAIEAYESIITLSSSLENLDSISAHDLSQCNNNINLEKGQKLRHAWGLLAVITCNMGADPEAQEECQRALRKVKNLTIGPSQDCDQELERLQKILEFNKARHQDSVSSSTASTSSPSQVLTNNWKGAREKENQEETDREERLAELVKEGRAILEASEAQMIDWNYLLSHVILFALAGFISYIFLMALPFSIFRHKF